MQSREAQRLDVLVWVVAMSGNCLCIGSEDASVRGWRILQLTGVEGPCLAISDMQLISVPPHRLGLSLPAVAELHVPIALVLTSGGQQILLDFRRSLFEKICEYFLPCTAQR